MPRLRYAAALLGLLLVTPLGRAAAYQAGQLKNHNHTTATGQGGRLNNPSFLGDTAVADALTVIGSATIQGALLVNGAASMANFSVSGNSFSVGGSTLVVSGGTTTISNLRYSSQQSTSTTWDVAFTVTRTDPGPVDAVTSTLTLVGFNGGEKAEVCYRCNWSGSSANQQQFYGILRDGAIWEGITPTHGLIQREAPESGGLEQPVFACALSPVLSAGTHTFAPLHWVASVTLTVNLGAFQRCEFWVKKVPA